MQRLARLEEQVVTWFLVITDVAPVSVTFHTKLWEQGMMQRRDESNVLSRCPRWKNQSSSTLYKKSSEVFDPLLFCLIRSFSRPKPCSGLWTVWNVGVSQQKNHHHRVSNQLPHLLLLSTYYTSNLLLFTLTFYSSMQHLLHQTSLLTRQRKKTGSMWKLVSSTTRTANSRASLCLRRRCHGRYSTCISTTSCWSSSQHHCIKRCFLGSRWFSCSLFSGRLQLIHADLLRLWRQWGPCGWVCFYQ